MSHEIPTPLPPAEGAATGKTHRDLFCLNFKSFKNLWAKPSVKQSSFPAALRLTALTLVAAMLMQDILWAAPAAKPFEFPRRLGEVVRQSGGQGGEIVINIQDAHNQMGAQYGIASILEELTQRYGLGMVALEGAGGTVDTSVVSSLPSPEARKKTGEFLLKSGQISAGEYFSIITDTGRNVALYGAEEETLYRRNLQAFRRVAVRQTRLAEPMQAVDAYLNKLEARVFSRPLRVFRAQARRWIEHADYSRKSWKRLTGAAAPAGIRPDGFGEIRKWQRTAAIEERIAFSQAAQEREMLFRVLAQTLDSRRARHLAWKTLQYRRGKASTAEFHNFLIRTARSAGVRITRYPQLALYARYVFLYERIQLAELITQIAEWQENVENRLAKTADEKALLDAARQFGLIRKLVGLKLSHPEYVRVRSWFRDNAGSRWIDTVRRLDVSAGLPLTAEDERRLVRALPDARRFYQLAIRRDRMLLENTLKKMRQDGVRTAALVTGGFHSEGLSQLMKDGQVSHLVIMPKFDPKDGERPYLTLLTRRPSQIREQLDGSRFTLSAPLERFTPEWLGQQANLRETVALLAVSARLVGADLLKSENSDPYLQQLERAWKHSGRTGVSPEKVRRELGGIRRVQKIGTPSGPAYAVTFGDGAELQVPVTPKGEIAGLPKAVQIDTTRLNPVFIRPALLQPDTSKEGPPAARRLSDRRPPPAAAASHAAPKKSAPRPAGSLKLRTVQEGDADVEAYLNQFPPPAAKKSPLPAAAARMASGVWNGLIRRALPEAAAAAVAVSFGSAVFLLPQGWPLVLGLAVFFRAVNAAAFLAHGSGHALNAATVGAPVASSDFIREGVSWGDVGASLIPFAPVPQALASVVSLEKIAGGPARRWTALGGIAFNTATMAAAAAVSGWASDFSGLGHSFLNFAAYSVAAVSALTAVSLPDLGVIFGGGGASACGPYFVIRLRPAGEKSVSVLSGRTLELSNILSRHASTRGGQSAGYVMFAQIGKSVNLLFDKLVKGKRRKIVDVLAQNLNTFLEAVTAKGYRALKRFEAIFIHLRYATIGATHWHNAQPVWHEDPVLLKHFKVDLSNATRAVSAEKLVVANMNEHNGDMDAVRMKLRFGGVLETRTIIQNDSSSRRHARAFFVNAMPRSSSKGDSDSKTTAEYVDFNLTQGLLGKSLRHAWFSRVPNFEDVVDGKFKRPPFDGWESRIEGDVARLLGRTAAQILAPGAADLSGALPEVREDFRAIVRRRVGREIPADRLEEFVQLAEEAFFDHSLQWVMASIAREFEGTFALQVVTTLERRVGIYNYTQSFSIGVNPARGEIVGSAEPMGVTSALATGRLEDDARQVMLRSGQYALVELAAEKVTYGADSNTVRIYDVQEDAPNRLQDPRGENPWFPVHGNQKIDVPSPGADWANMDELKHNLRDIPYVAAAVRDSVRPGKRNHAPMQYLRRLIRDKAQARAGKVDGDEDQSGAYDLIFHGVDHNEELLDQQIQLMRDAAPHLNIVKMNSGQFIRFLKRAQNQKNRGLKTRGINDKTIVIGVSTSAQTQSVLVANHLARKFQNAPRATVANPGRVITVSQQLFNAASEAAGQGYMPGDPVLPITFQTLSHLTREGKYRMRWNEAATVEVAATKAALTEIFMGIMDELVTIHEETGRRPFGLQEEISRQDLRGFRAFQQVSYGLELPERVGVTSADARTESPQLAVLESAARYRADNVTEWVDAYVPFALYVIVSSTIGWGAFSFLMPWVPAHVIGALNGVFALFALWIGHLVIRTSHGRPLFDRMGPKPEVFIDRGPVASIVDRYNATLFSLAFSFLTPITWGADIVRGALHRFGIVSHRGVVTIHRITDERLGEEVALEAQDANTVLGQIGGIEFNYGRPQAHIKVREGSAFSKRQIRPDSPPLTILSDHMGPLRAKYNGRLSRYGLDWINRFLLDLSDGIVAEMWIGYRQASLISGVFEKHLQTLFGKRIGTGLARVLGVQRAFEPGNTVNEAKTQSTQHPVGAGSTSLPTMSYRNPNAPSADSVPEEMPSQALVQIQDNGFILITTEEDGETRDYLLEPAGDGYQGVKDETREWRAEWNVSGSTPQLIVRENGNPLFAVKASGLSSDQLAVLLRAHAPSRGSGLLRRMRQMVTAGSLAVLLGLAAAGSAAAQQPAPTPTPAPNPADNPALQEYLDALNAVYDQMRQESQAQIDRQIQDFQSAQTRNAANGASGPAVPAPAPIDNSFASPSVSPAQGPEPFIMRPSDDPSRYLPSMKRSNPGSRKTAGSLNLDDPQGLGRFFESENGLLNPAPLSGGADTFLAQIIPGDEASNPAADDKPSVQSAPAPAASARSSAPAARPDSAADKGPDRLSAGTIRALLAVAGLALVGAIYWVGWIASTMMRRPAVRWAAGLTAALAFYGLLPRSAEMPDAPAAPAAGVQPAAPAPAPHADPVQPKAEPVRANPEIEKWRLRQADLDNQRFLQEVMVIEAETGLNRKREELRSAQASLTRWTDERTKDAAERRVRVEKALEEVKHHILNNGTIHELGMPAPRTYTVAEMFQGFADHPLTRIRPVERLAAEQRESLGLVFDSARKLFTLPASREAGSLPVDLAPDTPVLILNRNKQPALYEVKLGVAISGGDPWTALDKAAWEGKEASEAKAVRVPMEEKIRQLESEVNSRQQELERQKEALKILEADLEEAAQKLKELEPPAGMRSASGARMAEYHNPLLDFAGQIFRTARHAVLWTLLLFTGGYAWFHPETFSDKPFGALEQRLNPGGEITLTFPPRQGFAGNSAAITPSAPAAGPAPSQTEAARPDLSKPEVRARYDAQLTAMIDGDLADSAIKSVLTPFLKQWSSRYRLIEAERTNYDAEFFASFQSKTKHTWQFEEALRSIYQKGAASAEEYHHYMRTKIDMTAEYEAKMTEFKTRLQELEEERISILFRLLDHKPIAMEARIRLIGFMTQNHRGDIRLVNPLCHLYEGLDDQFTRDDLHTPEKARAYMNYLRAIDDALRGVGPAALPKLMDVWRGDDPAGRQPGSGREADRMMYRGTPTAAALHDLLSDLGAPIQEIYNHTVPTPLPDFGFESDAHDYDNHASQRWTLQEYQRRDRGRGAAVFPIRSDEDAERKAAFEAAVVSGRLEGLIPVITDPNPPVRAYAAWKLGASGNPRYEKYVRWLIHDSDPTVRSRAAAALGYFTVNGDANARDPKILDMLQSLNTFSNEDIDSRVDIVRGFGTLKNQQKALHLLSIVLGVGSEEIEKDLRTLWKDPAEWEEVRKYRERIFNTERPQPEQPYVQLQALRVLAQIGDSRAFDINRRYWSSLHDARMLWNALPYGNRERMVTSAEALLEHLAGALEGHMEPAVLESLEREEGQTHAQQIYMRKILKKVNPERYRELMSGSVWEMRLLSFLEYWRVTQWLWYWLPAFLFVVELGTLLAVRIVRLVKTGPSGYAPNPNPGEPKARAVLTFGAELIRSGAGLLHRSAPEERPEPAAAEAVTASAAATATVERQEAAEEPAAFSGSPESAHPTSQILWGHALQAAGSAALAAAWFLLHPLWSGVLMPVLRRPFTLFFLGAAVYGGVTLYKRTQDLPKVPVNVPKAAQSLSVEPAPAAPAPAVSTPMQPAKDEPTPLPPLPPLNPPAAAPKADPEVLRRKAEIEAQIIGQRTKLGELRDQQKELESRFASFQAEVRPSTGLAAWTQMETGVWTQVPSSELAERLVVNNGNIGYLPDNSRPADVRPIRFSATDGLRETLQRAVTLAAQRTLDADWERLAQFRTRSRAIIDRLRAAPGFESNAAAQKYVSTLQDSAWIGHPFISGMTSHLSTDPYALNYAIFNHSYMAGVRPIGELFEKWDQKALKAIGVAKKENSTDFRYGGFTLPRETLCVVAGPMQAGNPNELYYVVPGFKKPAVNPQALPDLAPLLKAADAARDAWAAEQQSELQALEENLVRVRAEAAAAERMIEELDQKSRSTAPSSGARLAGKQFAASYLIPASPEPVAVRLPGKLTVGILRSGESKDNIEALWKDAFESIAPYSPGLNSRITVRFLSQSDLEFRGNREGEDALEGIDLMLDRSTVKRPEAVAAILGKLAEQDAADLRIVTPFAEKLLSGENSAKLTSAQLAALVMALARSIPPPAKRLILAGNAGGAPTLAPELAAPAGEIDSIQAADLDPATLAGLLDERLALALMPERQDSAGEAVNRLNAISRKIADYLTGGAESAAALSEAEVQRRASLIAGQTARLRRSRLAVIDRSYRDPLRFDNTDTRTIVTDLEVFIKDGKKGEEGLPFRYRLERAKRLAAQFEQVLLVRDPSLPNLKALRQKYPQTEWYGKNVIFAPGADSVESVTEYDSARRIQGKAAYLLPDPGTFRPETPQGPRRNWILALAPDSKTTVRFLEAGMHVLYKGYEENQGLILGVSWKGGIGIFEFKGDVSRYLEEFVRGARVAYQSA